MNKIAVVLMLALATIAGRSSGDQTADKKPPGDDSIWRTAKKCATNSLYIVLRLNDVEIPYRDVDSILSVGEGGTSLVEVRDCAKNFGLQATILRANPESLANCPLPCIVHLEEERNITGHYVVVTAATPKRVEYIDGTTVVTSTVPMEQFRKNWTGYLLVFQRPQWWERFYPVIASLGALTLILALAIAIRRRRETPVPLPAAL